MSIIQFFRIFWARRWIILVAGISCLIGGMLVVKLIPPRYQATSRVMLDLMKPDPVTGEVVGSQAARAYVRTQIELIKDYGVAGKVVDQIGWLTDPALIQEYQKRPASDDRDFRRWAAQRIIAGTDADLVAGSNIMEISYTTNNPVLAKMVADAVRDAYIDGTLADRRERANRTADWFAEQAQKAQVALTEAESAKAAYEKQSGIVLGAGFADLETQRLQALAGQPAVQAPPPVMLPAPSSANLAAIDSEISQQSQILGPNHPMLQELKRRRVLVAAQVAKEEATATARARAAAGAGAGAIENALRQQKTKVIGERDQIEHLRQLQATVDLRRDQYSKLMSRAAEARQEGYVSTVGITPMGGAVTPQSPVFPNKPLIIIGSLGLGLGLGVLASLLAELLGRRVRGMEDLAYIGDVEIPMLAIVAAARRKRSPWRDILPKLGLRRARKLVPA